jgi:hypothetical protein
MKASLFLFEYMFSVLQEWCVGCILNVLANGAGIQKTKKTFQ